MIVVKRGSRHLLKFVHAEPGVADNDTHGYGVHRIIARDREKAHPLGPHAAPAIADDLNPGFCKARTARKRGPLRSWASRTATSTALASPTSRQSRSAARYSWIAAWMFSRASCSMPPCGRQPGNPGQATLHPPLCALQDDRVFHGGNRFVMSMPSYAAN